MQLKRLYKHDAPPDDWRRVTEIQRALWPDGTVAGEREVERILPPIRGVQIQHAPAYQRFPPRLITQGVREGWLAMDATTITVRGVVRGVEGAVRYRIERVPGRYCCHCDEKLQDDVTGELARLHVTLHHAGVASPHPGHPAGYGMTNAYEARRED